MNQHQFATLKRSLAGMPSRRHLLRGVAGAGLGLVGTRLPATVAKKKRRNKKRKRAHRRCDVCRRGCAFRGVQAAIDAARPGDTIRLCPGTYREHVAVTKNLTLLGAGADRTFLDGGGTASATAVLTIGSGVTVEVRALTVRGGNVGSGVGGGIDNEGALTLEVVNVTANKAEEAAGIYNYLGASLRLIDCRVSGNEATHGGGLSVEGGTVTLDRSHLTGNETGGQGGGLYIGNGEVTLNESDVTGNEAGGQGGGLYIYSGTLTLNRTRVTGNTAASGGGIYKAGGAVTIAPQSVTGNTPSNCGGQAVANCVN
jgi:hypothetical protein